MTHWHAVFAVYMVRGRESHWCNKPQVRHNVAGSLSFQHLPHHRKLLPPPSIFVACTSHGAKRAARLGVSPQGPVAPPPCSTGQTTKRAVQASGGTWCSVSGCMPIAHTDTAVTTSQDHLLKLAVAPPPLHTQHTHSRARSDIAAVLVGRHVCGGERPIRTQALPLRYG